MSGKGDARRPEVVIAPAHHWIFCRKCGRVHRKEDMCDPPQRVITTNRTDHQGAA